MTSPKRNKSKVTRAFISRRLTIELRTRQEKSMHKLSTNLIINASNRSDFRRSMKCVYCRANKQLMSSLRPIDRHKGIKTPSMRLNEALNCLTLFVQKGKDHLNHMHDDN